MSYQQALEIITAAARAYAQSIADDADKTSEQEAEEMEIWDALDALAGKPVLEA